MLTNPGFFRLRHELGSQKSPEPSMIQNKDLAVLFLPLGPVAARNHPFPFLAMPSVLVELGSKCSELVQRQPLPLLLGHDAGEGGCALEGPQADLQRPPGWQPQLVNVLEHRAWNSEWEKRVAW